LRGAHESDPSTRALGSHHNPLRSRAPLGSASPRQEPSQPLPICAQPDPVPSPFRGFIPEPGAIETAPARRSTSCQTSWVRAGPLGRSVDEKITQCTGASFDSKVQSVHAEKIDASVSNGSPLTLTCAPGYEKDGAAPQAECTAGKPNVTGKPCKAMVYPLIYLDIVRVSHGRLFSLSLFLFGFWNRMSFFFRICVESGHMYPRRSRQRL